MKTNIFDAKALARLRRQRNWTQATLSEKSGVSIAQIQKLEKGTHKHARATTIERLSRALGIDGEFFRHSLPPTKPILVEPCSRESECRVRRSGINFRWEAVETAREYKIILDGTHVKTISDPYWKPAYNLTAGTHSWYVVAVNHHGEEASTQACFVVVDLEPVSTEDVLKTSTNSPSYTTSMQHIPEWRRKLVCFDMDGVLVRFSKNKHFSWDLLWSHFKHPRELQQRGLQLYSSGEITYQEWCDYCLEYYTKYTNGRKPLRYMDFVDIIEDVQLSKNLIEALRDLQASGAILAIVSGGISPLLEYLIPDYSDIFKYVGINRFLFHNEILSEIVATPFDYKQKGDFILKICELENMGPEMAYFICDGPNDRAALPALNKKGVKTISFCPSDPELDRLSWRAIDTNDMNKVTEIILNT